MGFHWRLMESTGGWGGPGTLKTGHKIVKNIFSRNRVRRMFFPENMLLGAFDMFLRRFFLLAKKFCVKKKLGNRDPQEGHFPCIERLYIWCVQPHGGPDFLYIFLRQIFFAKKKKRRKNASNAPRSMFSGKNIRLRRIRENFNLTIL